MKAKKPDEEKRDKLGFTFEEYYAMQELADLDKANAAEGAENGWFVSKEQIDLINAPENPFHSIAVLCFFDANQTRLKRLACAFLRWRQELCVIVDAEDLFHQAYCDMLCGYLKLPHDTKGISHALCRCYDYAAVGGLEGVA